MGIGSSLTNPMQAVSSGFLDMIGNNQPQPQAQPQVQPEPQAPSPAYVNLPSGSMDRANMEYPHLARPAAMPTISNTPFQSAYYNPPQQMGGKGGYSRPQPMGGKGGFNSPSTGNPYANTNPQSNPPQQIGGKGGTPFPRFGDGFGRPDFGGGLAEGFTSPRGATTGGPRTLPAAQPAVEQPASPLFDDKTTQAEFDRARGFTPQTQQTPATPEQMHQMQQMAQMQQMIQMQEVQNQMRGLGAIAPQRGYIGGGYGGGMGYSPFYGPSYGGFNPFMGGFQYKEGGEVK